MGASLGRARGDSEAPARSPCVRMQRMSSNSHGGGFGDDASPYVELDRDAWAALGRETKSPLTTQELETLRGLGDALDMDELEQVYLPISRLLSLRVKAARRLH